MENPSTWTPVQKAIADVICLHDINSRTEPHVYGLSLPTLIYNRLKSEGFLKEEK